MLLQFTLQKWHHFSFPFFFFIVLQDRKTWNCIFLMLAWFRVYTCKWSFSYSCCYCLLLFNKDCIKDKSSAMIHALHYLSSKISEFRLTLDTCRTFDQECCICGPLYCIWFAGHHQNHETYTECTCTHTHIYIHTFCLFIAFWLKGYIAKQRTPFLPFPLHTCTVSPLHWV